MSDELFAGLCVFLGSMVIGLVWWATAPYRHARRVHRLLCRTLAFKPSFASVRSFSRDDLVRAERWAITRKGDMPLCVFALSYVYSMGRGLLQRDDVESDPPLPSPAAAVDAGGARLHG